MKATGYAVVQRGELLVRTVSSTPLAAMVNWLIVSEGLVTLNRATDEQVEAAFNAAAKARGAKLRQVTIAVTPSSF